MGKILVIIVLSLGLSGCSQEFDLPWEKDYIYISGHIPAPPEGTSSRTVTTGTNASFTSGDRIGVHETLTQRSNVLFTTTNGTAWSTSSTMYWFNPSATHTFYAYYPYNASNQGNTVSIPILANQTFTTIPDASCDMLVAGPKTQARTTSSSVILGFNHAFCLLEFDITTSTISTFSLKTMTLKGGNTAGGALPYGIVNTVNGISQVGYNLTTRSLVFTAANNTASTFAQTITKPVPSPGALGDFPVITYAILLPGQYTSPKLTIRFRILKLLGLGGESDSSEEEISPNIFTAGNKYKFAVKIKGGIIGRSSAPVMQEPEISVTLLSVEPL